MRVLDTSTLELREFVEPPGPYAILSHTWTDEEVTFKEYRKDHENIKHRTGYAKIADFCRISRQRGFRWAWVDTCCIDKRSSAELSEAINSMYQWYGGARECYVWLDDYLSEDPRSLADCKWFKRGWTLQELLAPACVVFFTAQWQVIGHKHYEYKGPCWCQGRTQTGSDAIGWGPNLVPELASITGITADCLSMKVPTKDQSIATRMSWASARQTTRVEDRAYSLLGLFAINMPLLYGEGSRAFQRLQEEIIKTSDDSSIFCARREESGASDFLLAASPDDFAHCRFITPGSIDSSEPYSVTNRGLKITVKAHKCFISSQPSSSVDEPPSTPTKLYIINLGCAGPDQRAYFSRPASVQYMYLIRRGRPKQYVRYALSSFEMPQVMQTRWVEVGEKMFYVKIRR